MPEDARIVLMDIGARGGMDKKWKGVPLQFIGFEPDPEECAKLNNPPYEIYLPEALWSEPVEKKPLYLIESPHGTSFYEPNYEFINSFTQKKYYAPKGTVTFDAIPLDQALVKAGISVVDVLKIDTEGAELEILKGGLRTLESVLAIELEVWFNSVQKNSPFFADIDPYLRARGFQLFDLAKANFFNRDGRWPKGQLVAGNALYFKVGMELDNNRLDRFITILVAYGFYDYALELVNDAKGLSAEQKRDRIDKINRAGKRLRFRGKHKLSTFFSKLARRLADYEQDHLGNHNK